MRMKKGLGEQEWGNLRLNDLKSLGLFLHTLHGLCPSSAEAAGVA